MGKAVITVECFTATSPSRHTQFFFDRDRSILTKKETEIHWIAQNNAGFISKPLYVG